VWQTEWGVGESAQREQVTDRPACVPGLEVAAETEAGAGSGTPARAQSSQLALGPYQPPLTSSQLYFLSSFQPLPALAAAASSSSCSEAAAGEGWEAGQD